MIKAEDNITLKSTKSIYDIASDTEQHFWFQSTGADTGAHITEIPQDEWNDNTSPNYQSGGNLLARSNGIAVRDGLTEIATFGANGTVNGRTSQMHTITDYHSFSMANKDGGVTFCVKSEITNDGYAYFEDTFTTASSKKFYTLSGLPTVTSVAWGGALIQVEILEVTLDGVALQESTDYTFSNGSVPQGINLVSYPTANKTLVVKYRSDSKYLCNFTFGERDSNAFVGYASYSEGLENKASGAISHAEGWGTTASGIASHAEGEGTRATSSEAHAEGSGTYASGIASHAEGTLTQASGSASHAGGRYTTAVGRAQTTIGEFNITDTGGSGTNRGTYVLIIGNGTQSNAKSNALTVDWSGNTAIAGTLTQGSDRRLKTHIAYLDEDAVDFIQNLKPAHFIKDNKHHTGFYAQDVEEVDKWGGMVGEMNGYKTLGYIEILAPLVAYCQHLERRIEELERG